MRRAYFFLFPIAMWMSGCGFFQLGTQKSSALVNTGETESATSAVGACGVQVFRDQVHQPLVNNCAQCHSGNGPGVGAHANASADVAYREARNKISFMSPLSSLLVSKASDTGHCPKCGVFGQTLGGLVTTFVKAENADPAVCAQYGGSSSSGGGGGGTGNYDPPPPPDVYVLPEGLAYFESQVLPIFRSNCITCHSPGNVMASVPLAHPSDSTLAYKGAKPRLDLADVRRSKILNRALDPAHGPGCVNCGPNLDTTTGLSNRLEQWRVLEDQGQSQSRVALAPSKVIGTPTTVQTLIWDLSANGIPGASFSIRVEMRPGTNEYKFSAPTLMTGASAVEVRDLLFRVDGEDNLVVTTYSSVSTVVPSRMTQPLSTSVALLPRTGTNYTISFQVLKISN